MYQMANILDEAKYLAGKIATAYKPEKIILFGSTARGETTTSSDIDLLIITSSDEKRPFRTKHVFEAIRGVKRDYPLDPIVYTPSEIEERLSLGDAFIKNILTEGKLLYGTN